MPKSSNKQFSKLLYKSARQRLIEELTLRARYLAKQYIENYAPLLFTHDGKVELHKHFESIFNKTREKPYLQIRTYIYKVLYEYGYKYSEIAEVFGICRTTVYRSILDCSKNIKKDDICKQNYLFLKNANENFKYEKY